MQCHKMCFLHILHLLFIIACSWNICWFLFSSNMKYCCSREHSDESTYLRSYAACLLTSPVLEHYGTCNNGQGSKHHIIYR
nr:hypothetical protein Iba_chr06eCG0180 [Ipomoea batatas]